MTRLRLEDLPPNIRDQITAKLGVDNRRRALSRAGISEHDPCPGHCHQCGQPFPNPHAWMTHIAKHHGGRGRWVIDLDQATTSQQ